MTRSNNGNNTRRGSGNARRRAGASRQQPAPAPAPRVWRWFGSGLGIGLILALSLYLVTLPPAPEDTDGAVDATASTPAQDDKDRNKPRTSPPKPRFEFYTMLPEQTIDVEVDPAEVAQPRSGADKVIYLLQAGSFRQREDADRRRAELILLGLEPRIEESSTDNGRWFRVFLGPFDAHAKMSRARSLTTAQGIETLLLKRQA